MSQLLIMSETISAVDRVLNNASNIATAIAVFVSIASAIYTYRTNKKRLEVDIEDKSFQVDYFTDAKGNIVYPELSSFPQNQKPLDTIIVKVVNPSPHDIGFFDLVITEINNPLTNIVPLKKSNVLNSNHESKFIYGCRKERIDTIINLVETSYGVFPSNSFSRLDLPISVNDDVKHVTVRFKVAIPSKKRVPNSIHRTKYKYYSKNVSLVRDTNNEEINNK